MLSWTVAGICSLARAGKFGFDQDLGNVETLQPASGHALKGSFAQLLIDCSYDVTCNYQEILWFARFWRSDVRKSWQHYKSYLVRAHMMDGLS